MKKIIVWITAIIILLSCIITVFAVGKDSTSLKLHVLTPDSLPPGTIYIDLLLPFDNIPECFTESTDSNTTDSILFDEKIQIPIDSQIENYNTDGFFSYFSHFNNSKIAIKNGENNDLWILFGDYYNDDLYYFQKCSSIKLAYVDINGNIIKTTEDFSVHNRLFSVFQSLELNGEKIKCVYSINTYHCVPLLILLVLLSVAIIVKLVDFKKHRRRFAESTGDGTMCD